MTAREEMIGGIQRLLDNHGAEAFREYVARTEAENAHGDPPQASDSSPCVSWVLTATWQDLTDGCAWRFVIVPDRQLLESTVGLLTMATGLDAL